MIKIKKILRFVCPCLMIFFEMAIFFVEEDTIEFYGTFLGFTVCMLVSAYLWRKELF